MTFTIPYPGGRGKQAFCRRFGTNAYYAGKHWAQRKQDKDEVQATVTACLLGQKVPRRPFGVPAEVVFRWNDSLDIDNHSVLGKMILDALKGWVIEDDDRKWVTRVIHEFHDEPEIRVTLREAKGRLDQVSLGGWD